MEFRLGNQQRHSITAVLLSAVVIIFGLVLVDVLSSPESDPLGTRTAAIDTSTTSAEPGPSKPGDELTAGVARSNARFTLNPDVTVVEAETSTTASAVRRTTSAPGAATSAPAAPTTTTTSSVTIATIADVPETSASSTTSSTMRSTTVPTTTATTVKPKGKPSTTVVDDETTTTKKCRGNRPGCRQP